MAHPDLVCSIIVNSTTHDLFMLRRDARALHNAKLLQKIEGRAAYCAPRSWRQIAHGRWPSLHPEVLALCAFTPMELRSTPRKTKEA